MLAKHKVAGSTPVTRSNPHTLHWPFSTTSLISGRDRSDAVQTPLKFATSNKHKFTEVQAILADYGIPVEMAPMELREIQADALEEIAAEKPGRHADD